MKKVYNLRACSDLIWEFRKLPVPSHLGKYFIKIWKTSAKIHETEKINLRPFLDW